LSGRKTWWKIYNLKENPLIKVNPLIKTIKKVCLVGTQSTGKTVLTQKLAAHFNTTFVDEVGREVVPVTTGSTMELLHKIAIEHANKIIEKTKEANKILFIDTDLIITKSYSRFLFNKELIVEAWIETANQCDLYLYSTKEAPFHQDGTRLNEDERNLMDKSHLEAFKKAGVELHFLTGSWEVRFKQALDFVNALIEQNGPILD